MSIRQLSTVLLLMGILLVAVTPATSQSFRVQCPNTTVTHPNAATNNSESPYVGPTEFALNSSGYVTPTANVNGAIKCQQVSGGDGYSTMANGTQTFMFSFGPLSGLEDIANGLPGTQYPSVFNTMAPSTLLPGDPATTDGMIANTWTPAAELPIRPGTLHTTARWDCNWTSRTSFRSSILPRTRQPPPHRPELRSKPTLPLA